MIYTGPKLVVKMKLPSGYIVRGEGRLNNPRKTENAVLKGVCADLREIHPRAKLVSFYRQEGR